MFIAKGFSSGPSSKSKHLSSTAGGLNIWKQGPPPKPTPILPHPKRPKPGDCTHPLTIYASLGSLADILQIQPSPDPEQNLHDKEVYLFGVCVGTRLQKFSLEF